MAFVLGPRAEAAGHRLAAFETIGSTNDEALARARADDAGPLWIASRHQTSGRGRRGRSWTTTEGNLAASLLMMIDAPLPAATGYGLAAGLAVFDAVAAVAPSILCGAEQDSRLALKWPNDLLLDGEKLAGILIETERFGANRLALVIGIGVNVVAAPAGLPYPATSLRAKGIGATAEALFSALTDAWVEAEARFATGGFAELRRMWLERAAGLGQPMIVQVGRERHRGIFETLDPEGRLVLREAHGAARLISAGDVQFGPAAEFA